MSTEGWINVKVRFRDERKWYFVASGGRVTRLRIHAGTFADLDTAKRTAADVITYEDDNVVASRVDVEHRTVARFGEPTPPRPAAPVYGPAGGFRYLVDVTAAGLGVFHVRNEDGTWGVVNGDVYVACHADAKRAGIEPRRRMNVHGSICTYQTNGMRFVQRSNRPDLDRMMRR